MLHTGKRGESKEMEIHNHNNKNDGKEDSSLKAPPRHKSKRSPNPSNGKKLADETPSGKNHDPLASIVNKLSEKEKDLPVVVDYHIKRNGSSSSVENDRNHSQRSGLLSPLSASKTKLNEPKTGGTTPEGNVISEPEDSSNEGAERRVRYSDLEEGGSESGQKENVVKFTPTPQKTGTPLSPILKKRDRSASIAWVDYLTEDANCDNIDDDDDDQSSFCSGDGRKLFHNRKTWFEHHISDAGETDDEEEDGISSEAPSRRNSPSNLNFRRRISSLHASHCRRHSNQASSENRSHRNVDDLIFDMFQDKDEEVVLVGKFLSALEKTGLRPTDQRLKELYENLRLEHKRQESASPKRNVGSIETLRLDRETFRRIITDNIVLISRAFRQQFVIPEFQTFCGQIEELYYKCKEVKGGKVASYIPQLARVDPNYWGVSICTIDGQRFSVGDTTVPFTLQSCSKPLTYAIALNELGQETVHQYVGQEPSGRMFNELVLDYNKKPHNPMVNAGAIIVCSLLKTMVRPEMTLAEKFDYTHHYFKRLCGGEYNGFNNAVFLSEREAADRNYALGFYMRENKCFPEGTNLKECMDYYFQCCSMETNCESTAVMAATLANGGICPTTGEKVLKSESVRDVLSLMHSCGMYDYSGQFAFKVGLPAKSGVCGAVILVIPNVMGMAVWSPPLDALGNTVRGVSLCQEIVEMFNFHKYDNLRHASNKIDPRRHRHETKGLNIVNLLFSAASGDVTSMRRHHLSGMDMTSSDYDGRTALHLAAAEGHIECVEYLLRLCHVSHKPQDRWGHLPIDDAERFGHADVVEFLTKWAEKDG